MGNIGAFARFHDAYDVEANASEYLSTVGEVDLGSLSHSALFDGGHGFDGGASGERAAHLDLDKDQGRPIEGYEVNFAPAAAKVAFEDVVAPIDQINRSGAFAFVAQSRGNACPEEATH